MSEEKVLKNSFLSNKFLEEAKTKLVPMPESALFPVEISFWREIWQQGELRGRIRSLYAEIRYGDNHIIVTEQSVHELLQRIAHILLALTDGR